MADEKKKNPPNLFTDPNFVGMSQDGRFVVANLLVYTQAHSAVPGLFHINEPQGQGTTTAALDRFIAYWAERSNAATSPTELLAELKVFGWLQVDLHRNLVRIPKAPLFMPPTDRGVAARWASALSMIPWCDLRALHLQTLREACSHDAELSIAFMSCLVDGDSQHESPYGE